MVGKRGIVFVIIKDGKILLQKRIRKDGFYFGYTIVPGGKIEKGESQEEALVREVQEEASVKALNWKKLGEIEFKEKGKVTVISVFFISKYKGRIIGIKTKMGEMVWVPYKNIMKVCKHPISRKIIKIVNDFLLSQKD